MTRHAVVLSGQGRLHMATEQPGLWLGYCGSRITAAAAVLSADWDLLALGPVPVCRYCNAIADAVALERLRAGEAEQDQRRQALTQWAAA